MTSYFSNKVIYIISPEIWGRSLLSKHHYAIALARDNQVFFIQRDSEADHGKVIETPYSENLVVVNYTKSPRGLRLLPAIAQKQIFKSEVQKLKVICGLKPDVVWSFDNSVWFDMSAFGEVLRIAHIVDYNMDYETKTHAQSADLCLGVTHAIVDRLKIFNPNSHFTNHAWDPKSFSPPEKITGKITAFYAGNLLIPFIDKKLILSLVEAYPDVDFVFAGSIGKDNLNHSAGDQNFISKLQTTRNVQLTGVLSQAELWQQMCEANIMLLLYDANQFGGQVANSHKIMDYLASGNVVVGNYTSEYQNTGLIEMGRSLDEIFELFGSVKENLGDYNGPTQVNYRRQFAAQNTYDHRLQFITSLIPGNKLK